jgi:TolA-binding protein
MQRLLCLVLCVSVAGLWMTGCQQTAEAPAGGDTASTTGGSAPVDNKSSFVGTYSPDPSKQIEEMKKQVEEMKKTNPAQAAEMEKMMKEQEAQMMEGLSKMTLELKADNTFVMTMNMEGKEESASGKITVDGDKITITPDTVNGKPAEGNDKDPATGTFDAAAGTLTMNMGGADVVWKRK